MNNGLNHWRNVDALNAPRYYETSETVNGIYTITSLTNKIATNSTRLVVDDADYMTKAEHESGPYHVTLLLMAFVIIMAALGVFSNSK